MSEHSTKNITPDEKFGLIRNRVEQLEAFTVERQHDARQRLDRLQKELSDTRAEIQAGFNEVNHRLQDVQSRLKHVELKLEVLTLDIMDNRAEQRELHRRVDDLERPTS
jgi:tetrahydromethanopterin S-methyltransferase subunit G